MIRLKLCQSIGENDDSISNSSIVQTGENKIEYVFKYIQISKVRWYIGHSFFYFSVIRLILVLLVQVTKLGDIIKQLIQPQMMNSWHTRPIYITSKSFCLYYFDIISLITWLLYHIRVSWRILCILGHKWSKSKYHHILLSKMSNQV